LPRSGAFFFGRLNSRDSAQGFNSGLETDVFDQFKKVYRPSAFGVTAEAMEAAVIVVGEAVVVGFAVVDWAITLPVLSAALEALEIQPERSGQDRKLQGPDLLIWV
jgi:hypothetical protein